MPGFYCHRCCHVVSLMLESVSSIRHAAAGDHELERGLWIEKHQSLGSHTTGESSPAEVIFEEKKKNYRKGNPNRNNMHQTLIFVSYLMIALFSLLQLIFHSVMTLHTLQYTSPSMVQGSPSPVAKCCRVFYLFN